MARIDLNADLGEGDAFDDELLQIVSSCNVACGGHAGNTESMTRTVRSAIANGVAVGAHPGYPDREGFGHPASLSVCRCHGIRQSSPQRTGEIGKPPHRRDLGADDRLGHPIAAVGDQKDADGGAAHIDGGPHQGTG